MKYLIFLDRYNKQTPFLQTKDPRFEIIRKPLYKHNWEAQDNFFSQPIYSFLFAAFGLFESGEEFLLSKC